MSETVSYRVKKCIIERLNLRINPEDITDDAMIFATDDYEEPEEGAVVENLGLDSIDALEIIVAIGKEFDVKIEDDDMEVLQNLQTLTDYVSSKIS
jgi:acyl carrier protein